METICYSFPLGLLILVLSLVKTDLRAQIQLHNDEFDDANTITNWINVNDEEGLNISQLEAYNINDSVAGQFFIKPFTESWFNEYRGAYLFKYISGDFVLTTEVTATNHAGSGLPSSEFSLAGLMIREPVTNPLPDPNVQPGQQNYVFISIGQATVAPQNDGWNFEIKNTCHSHSCLNIDNINFNTAKIRLARIGNHIIALSQLPGGSWEVRNRYDKLNGTHCHGGTCNAPFPDTVQIGLVSYTDWGKVSSYSPAFHNSHTLHPDSLESDPSAVAFNPDIIANYDFARFDSIPSALYGIDLTTASDQTLLDHLGYETQKFCPENFSVFEEISGQYMRISASEKIVAESEITDNANVIFGASNEIVLNSGFVVENNSLFQIIIEGCNP